MACFRHLWAPRHVNPRIQDLSKTEFIPNGDMVMLINLYRYIKDNDIQNEFINPNGKNHE
jgi:hypothetical protein